MSTMDPVSRTFLSNTLSRECSILIRNFTNGPVREKEWTIGGLITELTPGVDPMVDKRTEEDTGCHTDAGQDNGRGPERG